VQGHLRTADAVTRATGTGWILAATLAAYGVLAVALALVLRHLAAKPLPPEAAA
jgi:hypothetical protein